MFGGGDEVGEGVALFVHARGIVPGFAEFAAAAHVGDGVDHAAVEKAQAIRTEADWDGDAVAAVAVEEQRSAGVAWSFTAIDDREGNARAIRCGRVQALTDVLLWIVPAEDRLLLAENLLAGAEVVIEDGARGDEGFVLEAEVVGDEFGIGAEGSVVNRLGECDSVRGCERVAGGGLRRAAQWH